MVNREKFESIVDYTTVLSNFEGPLDLLLYLVNKDEIEIKDIFVSQVTEQFLDYMKGLAYIDVDKVSEYLNIAASLIKIKAYYLVPNIEEDPVELQEIEQEKDAILQSLYEQYQLIRGETQKLKELETIGYYFKEPDSSVGETRTVFNLEGLTLDGLIAAFSTVLLNRESRKNDAEVREIPRDEYTVAQKVDYILGRLDEGEVVFESLFENGYSRSEVVTTFQALLELLKLQYLRVKQEGEFGEIRISRNPDRKEEPLGEIDEYH